MHIPVMKDEILKMMEEMPSPPARILDTTFGRGGHTRAFLDGWPEAQVVALDQDQAALDHGQEYFKAELESGRLQLIHSNFVHLDKALPNQQFDVVFSDLGVSSPQLDDAERGFSVYHDGPLDMRMDQSQGLTAADIVNEWSANELADLFFQLGEVRRPQKVVARILEAREEKPFERTRELSILIERAEGWRKKGHHPATKYFLALRLKVNRELDVIEEALPVFMNALNHEGRLIVLTFHSLEDRIVKWGMKNRTELGRLVNKKVIPPTREEQLKNPRSRSAKLRVFERLKEEQ